MKKLFCIIALGAISFGSVFAATPVNGTSTVKNDTTMKKKVKMKSDTGKMKMKMKKDTTKI